LPDLRGSRKSENGGKSRNILKHQPVSIPDVVLQFFERLALTEDARDLRKTANEPLAVLPVLELKAK
jgi:hypothetical protein